MKQLILMLAVLLVTVSSQAYINYYPPYQPRYPRQYKTCYDHTSCQGYESREKSPYDYTESIAVHSVLALGTYAALRQANVKQNYSIAGALGISLLVSAVQQFSRNEYDREWKALGVNSLGAGVGLMVPLFFDF